MNRCRVQYRFVTKARTLGFWARLVEASREQGLDYSPSAIARELDVWPSAVTKWMAGTGLPTKKHLVALAIARGLNTEWLLSGQGEKYAKKADAVSSELYEIWARLPDAPRRRLLAAARYELTLLAAQAGESAIGKAAVLAAESAKLLA